MPNVNNVIFHKNQEKKTKYFPELCGIINHSFQYLISRNVTDLSNSSLLITSYVKVVLSFAAKHELTFDHN